MPGFAAVFLVDGKPPEPARCSSASASPTRSITSPVPASTTSTAATSARHRCRPRPASAARSRAPTSKQEASFARRFRCGSRDGHALQHAAADPGPRLADHPRPLRAARRQRGESFEHVHGLVEATKRAFLVRDRDVTDPAYARRPSDRISRLARPRGRAIDRKRGARPGGGGEKRRHDLARRHRRQRPRRLLHPVDLLGIRLGRRPAADRHHPGRTAARASRSTQVASTR